MVTSLWPKLYLRSWKDSVHRFERLMKATDPELAAHCGRSGKIALDIGTYMGLEEKSLEVLALGTRLHDIGKIFIDREILDKPGPLDSAEWDELRKHPLLGYELVRGHVPGLVAEMVLTHHERFDGSGYPRGLTGHQIPLESRILQVADAIDAITSERPYQPALPLAYAISELVKYADSQFDPAVVTAVLSLIDEGAWLTFDVSVVAV